MYAVIVSHEDSDASGHDLSPAAVSYTSGFYQIPVVGISSRDAAFSDKNIHVSFLRTVPPYYHQADVWLEILSHFGYTKVIMIHSSDTDGRAILGKLQTTSLINYDDVDVRANVETIIEFEPKLESFAAHLADLRSAQSRVYLLYAKYVMLLLCERIIILTDSYRCFLVLNQLSFALTQQQQQQ